MEGSVQTFTWLTRSIRQGPRSSGGLLLQKDLCIPVGAVRYIRQDSLLRAKLLLFPGQFQELLFILDLMGQELPVFEE